jgi:hypothetical protein
MSYADQLMSTGERIHLRDRQHWFMLIWAGRYAWLAIVLALVLFFLGSQLATDGVGGTFRQLVGLGTAALLIGGIVGLVWEALKYRNQEYVLTNRRVIQVGGVVNKHSTDSSLEKINDAALTQSVFGRMFGFGDLDILTAAETGIDRFRMIHDPIAFKRAILDAKHEYEQDMSRGPMPVSPPLRATPESQPSARPVERPLPPRDPDETSSTAISAGVPPAGPAVAPPRPPEPAPGPPRMSGDEVTRTLASLADLRDRGAISPEEFEAKKSELLARL